MKIAKKSPDVPFENLLTVDDVARRLAVPRVVVCLCVMMDYLPAVHVAGVLVPYGQGGQARTSRKEVAAR